MASILHVVDEPALGHALDETLHRAGHQPVSARGVPDALQVLDRGGIDLVLCDFRMAGLTGLELLALLQREGYDVPLVMLTDDARLDQAVASMRAGALDYATKPLRPPQLELAVERALEIVRMRREIEGMRQEMMGQRVERQLVGESEAMRGIRDLVAAAGPTRSTVLFHGESGTGKALLARAVHDLSDRRDRPFIKLNCAALTEGVMESALFGHEKGAVPGATRRAEGALERAFRGTLLLDEVSAMDRALQARLRRALDAQAFQRLGGAQPIRMDVRLVATSTRDLAAEAAAGRFDAELLARLGAIVAHVPPLRERPEDVPLLAHRFATRTAAEIAKAFGGIDPEALAMLVRRDWPGNVRELRYAVERAVILSADAVLSPAAFVVHRAPAAEDAPPDEAPPAASRSADGGETAIVLTTLNVDEAERALIARALQLSGGNRTRAAERLGLSVRTLRNKLNPRASDAG